MKVFEVTWLDEDNPKIDGRFQFVLPAVRCGVCDRPKSVLGLAYPSIKGEGLKRPDLFKRAFPVNQTEWDSLFQEVSAENPRLLPLPPGTEFGAFTGRVVGKVGDFAWAYWTPFVSEATLLKLAEKGIRLRAEPAELDFEDAPPEPYYVMEMQMHDVLAQKTFHGQQLSSCAACNRASYTLPLQSEKIFVNGSVVPPDAMVFRLGEHPARILATETFQSVVESMRLTDIQFKQVSVI